MIENEEIFQNRENGGGEYDAKLHLAEMIALLGPPPKEFVTDSGRQAKSAREHFGGPYFDSQGGLGCELVIFALQKLWTYHLYELGKFLHESIVPQRKLEDALPSLEEEDRKLFIPFLKRMLAWAPEDRSSPLELLKDPFIDMKKLLE